MSEPGASWQQHHAECGHGPVFDRVEFSFDISSIAASCRSGQMTTGLGRGSTSES